MSSHIRLAPANGAHVIKAGNLIIGHTKRAIELHEGSYNPVLYVPREDVDMSKLERSARQTTCPHKGNASYYNVLTSSGRLDNVVWSYETPINGLTGIAGYLAFYPAVTVSPT